MAFPVLPEDCDYDPAWVASLTFEPGHSISYKVACAPSEDRSACSSAQSKQSIHGILWIPKDLKHHKADSEDLTACRLNWVFAGCTLAVLWPCSFVILFCMPLRGSWTKVSLAPRLFFFSCSTQLSMKLSLLINMKMPTIVGIFIFISR